MRHDVGGDEDQVAPPARHHAGAEGAHQSLRPADVDAQHLLEVLRASSRAPSRAGFAPALDTRISTGPNAASRLLGERSDRGGIGQVEVEGHRLAPLGPDGRGDLLADLDPARPEHDRMAGPGQRACRLGADARRGAGHHRRPALGVGLEARHQRGVTVVGQARRSRAR